MKYVLFAALLATFPLAQGNETDTESLCAARPYVGVCAELEQAFTGARQQPVRKIVGGGGKGDGSRAISCSR